MTPASSASPGDLPTEQLETLLRRSDLPPEQRSIIEEELTQRLAMEFRGEPNGQDSTPYHQPPPSQGSGHAPSSSSPKTQPSGNRMQPSVAPGTSRAGQGSGHAPSSSSPKTQPSGNRMQPSVAPGTSRAGQGSGHTPSSPKTQPSVTVPAGGRPPSKPVGKSKKSRSSARVWILVLLLIAAAGGGIVIARSHLHNNAGGSAAPTEASSSTFNSNASQNQAQTFTAYVVVPAGLSDIYAYQYPSTSSNVVNRLVSDQAVRIECTAQGDEVSENGQTSSLWDGTNYGYIPDVEVYTGTNQATMPNCPAG